MSPAGDLRVHALAPDGRGLSCPACGWRVRAVAPEIETESRICSTCGELIYSGRLDEWPARTDEPPLAR